MSDLNRIAHRVVEQQSRDGAVSRDPTGGLISARPDFIERFYRLQVQIYNDYKALGLGHCLGPPPRAPISG